MCACVWFSQHTSAYINRESETQHGRILLEELYSYIWRERENTQAHICAYFKDYFHFFFTHICRKE